MLILRRNERERIVITLPDGEEITVTVVEIRVSGFARSVRLGFEAPPSVRVDREEVHLQRQESAD